MNNEEFIHQFNMMERLVHENSIKHGFWSNSDNINIPTKLALIHSEVSEALESHRTDKNESEHIEGFTGLEEELADVIIRIMDLSFYLNLDLARAVIAKHKYNTTRPVMHGGKKY